MERSNLKTAVCISSLRSWKMTIEELKKNIIEPMNADVFIYAWDRERGWKQRSRDNIYNRFFVDDPAMYNNGELIYYDEEELIEAFSPEDITIETFEEEYKDVLWDIERPEGILNNPNWNKWSQYCLPMFYTMYRCNCLKIAKEALSGQKYDVVIKARTDIRFPKIPNMVLENLDQLWYYPMDHNEDHVVSDKFAVSSSEIMDYYCDVFPRLTKYWSEGLTNSKGYPKIGEELMWHHFYDKAPEIDVLSWGADFYDAVRAKGIRDGSINAML